ncbi:hypothetical protein RND71_025075 [Anisodus tanguticus]|uniref:Uncharacterized protein n=1 Tax=Anisodus tanguticus TaxID=243964 RepID=A0AAE1RRT5_9SOLA|nr:hypothetical protein RND71_025075 [Anisodus tanguticus]
MKLGKSQLQGLVKEARFTSKADEPGTHAWEAVRHGHHTSRGEEDRQGWERAGIRKGLFSTFDSRFWILDSGRVDPVRDHIILSASVQSMTFTTQYKGTNSHNMSPVPDTSASHLTSDGTLLLFPKNIIRDRLLIMKIRGLISSSHLFNIVKPQFPNSRIFLKSQKLFNREISQLQGKEFVESLWGLMDLMPLIIDLHIFNVIICDMTLAHNLFMHIMMGSKTVKRLKEDHERYLLVLQQNHSYHYNDPSGIDLELKLGCSHNSSRLN